MRIAVLLGLGVLIMTSLAGCATNKAQAGREEVTMTAEGKETAEVMESAEVMETAEGQKEAGTRETAYHKISAQEAKKMMDGPDVTIVDVRTTEEYKESHIQGAINLPNEEIGDSDPELLGDKDAVLLIYCRSGRRSKEASDKLAELGYTQIYDFGGIIDWTYGTVTE